MDSRIETGSCFCGAIAAEVLFEPLSGVLIAGLVLMLLGIGTLVVNDVIRRQQVKDL